MDVGALHWARACRSVVRTIQIQAGKVREVAVEYHRPASIT
jgi:hypothetical protein